MHICACGRVILPVIGGQLAAPDIWHRSDPTALVLPIPNGAGHLQHTQDTAVPKMRGKHIRTPLNRSIIWTLALFAQQEQGPGVAAHTPRRIALKWEPLRTVREEPLALSRNTEVYWPVYREGRPPGVSLGTASLQGHPHSTCPRTWSQGLAGLALKPSASDPYSSAFSAAPWAPPVPRGSLWFTCLGASPCSGPESSRVKQASLLHAELVRAPQWGVRVVLPHRPGQRPI